MFVAKIIGVEGGFIRFVLGIFHLDRGIIGKEMMIRSE